MVEEIEVKCDTDAIVQKMEDIAVLKSLRKEVETGRISPLISVDAINAEIENQRLALQEAIGKCGSLEGVPEGAMAELEEPELEPEITPEENPVDEVVQQEDPEISARPNQRDTGKGWADGNDI